MRRWTRVPRGTVLVTVFVSGVLCGAGLSEARAGMVDATYKKLRVFGQVLAYVQSNYVDGIQEDELVYDAISGMLSDLDPHTTFMRPEQYQKLKEDTAGEFGGLGIEVTEDDQVGIRIDNATPDGPADRAGIKAGDRIVSVDGEDTTGFHLQEVVKRMRGVPGTKVVLGIRRPGWKRARDIPLIRRHVRVGSVAHRLLDKEGVGYVHIRAFQERTDHELGEALRDLRRAGKQTPHRKLKGLILDLRDNPGGLFDEGIKVADRFLKEGVIVTTKGRNPDNNEVDRAHPRGTEGDYPIAVLVNEGTASASEIVAGALQDQKRAKLVGTKTYGKGSVQTLFGLDDGSGLKLTVARYFTPSGRSINDTGIDPDVLVRAGPALEPGPDILRTDVQVIRALQVVQNPDKF